MLKRQIFLCVLLLFIGDGGREKRLCLKSLRKEPPEHQSGPIELGSGMADPKIYT